ncbi:adenylate/guanylate cyclase domain-containing protein [Blastococcus sp. MG754426]|uniref:adenylate/guanylate cyclase domain-containing protein n=1 Tax=unclassified Blastococcus TaxID=2619396 RepID=UPI001EEFA5A5|nr:MULTISPECIES: adenylate/guanylate cyclase domain-containing protein [unclassified Blastococcus]MCF6508224.1 adenylate/guanylate cyclase domain-containing protein [Blastococcus sp. MG754426]MCF6513810.1 adenylate/guanylate cyclase domain-containing protein [Blastococcus sp. MG754427]
MLPSTRYARSGELSIAYQVVGDGPLDLVAAPGFISHLDWNWQEPSLRRFLQRLAEFSRLILFDKRGTGLSDPVPGPATLEERTDDLRAVMDAAGSEQAALLGVSEGGAMAMLFAAQHPERTRALVLYGAYPRIVEAPDFPAGLQPEVMAALLTGMVEHWGEGVGLGAWAPERRHDTALRAWWGTLQRMGASPGMARRMFELYPQIDLRDVLPAIRVPTLVLHRRGDRMIPVGIGRYLAERIPGARLVELDGADHLFFLGDTETPLAEIEEFLTGSRPAPPAVSTVLATVLFADVAGSTELVARVGDAAWAGIRERFLALARGELARFGGVEVDVAGDGLLATFDGPARAIRCALAVQDSAGAAGVRLRVGVHAGEVQRLDGGHIAGLAVHIGARVMAEAEPGEVLVSGTVKDLVVGSGLGFADRGVRTLRGVPGSWPLFAVST